MRKNLILFILAFIFVSCEQKTSHEVIIEDVKSYKQGDIITLKGVEGGERKIKRLKNGFELVGDEKKIIIFDFFGTFCPPCQKEARELTNLQINQSDEISLIGLTTYEDVSDEDVVENFAQKYNAHYFISNDKMQNQRLQKTITSDISYPQAIQLPFKVVLKNAKYQILSDVWDGKKDVKYYIGDVGIKTIKKDLEKIKALK